MRYFFAFCFALFYGLLLGQDVILKEVTFHAPCLLPGVNCQTTCTGDENGWVRINYDETGGSISNEANSTLAWKFGGTTKPVAYVSGYFGRVSAKFSKGVSSTCALDKIYVRGIGDDGYNLCPKLLKSTGDFLAESFNIKFPLHVVNYLDKFTIRWSFTKNPLCLTDPDATSIEWTYIGESKNPLYLTYATPIKGTTLASPAIGGFLDEATTFFKSSLHISCLAASGKSTENDVVNSIYSAFQNRCVSKEGSNNCMKYWGPKVNFCNNIYQMLKYEDGHCGEWALFFNDMIKIHGISGSKVTLVTCGVFDVNDFSGTLPTTIPPLLPPPIDYIANFQTQIDAFFGSEKINVVRYDDALLLVNNWDFTFGEHFFGSWNYNTTPHTITLMNSKTITSADNNGVAAQGTPNENPYSRFGNHALVVWNQSIYDPSYGANVYSTEFEWAINSLKATMVGLCIYTKNNVMNEVLWLNDKDNIPIVPLTFSN
jgi:hypothetical protein